LFAQFWLPLTITEPLPLIVALALEVDARVRPPVPVVSANPLVLRTTELIAVPK